MQKTKRPWGSYTVLEKADTYKIKGVEVLPHNRISLQKHLHRSEHWVVVAGTANVSCGGVKKVLKKNQSTYVPKDSIHRIENNGDDLLIIIEVQNGNYLEEDDIIRYNDDYGRHEKQRKERT